MAFSDFVSFIQKPILQVCWYQRWLQKPALGLCNTAPILNITLNDVVDIMEPNPVEGLAQDYSNSIASALELLQFCTKPSL